MTRLGHRESAFISAEVSQALAFAKQRDQSPAKRLYATLKITIDALETTRLWQSAMLVTCVEVYLRDLLEAAASVDPELMSNSEQRVFYTEVVAACSLEELLNDMRARWARAWVTDGGPTRWIGRLERMGARYVPGLAEPLELVWGIRHVAVHSAGTATAEFVKRHPGIVEAVGVRVRVNDRELGNYLNAAAEFLRPTEAFALARWPRLRVQQSTDEPNF